MKQIINARDPVRTEVWDRARAVEYYRGRKEPYKLELLDRIPEGQDIRMYWHGDWQDLCRGPHLQHTGQVPADGFKLTHVAGAYWLGDATRPMLQRIYGVAFKNRDDLKAHMTMLEEAAKRDHRKLGREMQLFHMQEEAPGQVFWHPNGWTIYTTLQDYMRRQQRRDGYVEVNTPQVVNRKLWEASGHGKTTEKNMFIVEVDEEGAREKVINALKPMNCPCHVQIFNQGIKSYRDLPLRIAEFGSCARYEPSGALHGIMRVRGFTQDDAHIFCTLEQVEAESKKFIDFLSRIYADLGFDKWRIKLSTRPEKRVGSDEIWDKMEAALANAVTAAGRSYEIFPGEGAFYAPILEFVLTDAIGAIGSAAPSSLIRTCRASGGGLHRRGRDEAPPLHVAPRLPWQFRAVHRHPDREPRRQAAVLAGAPAGGGGLHRVRCRSFRGRDRHRPDARRCAGRGRSAEREDQLQGP